MSEDSLQIKIGARITEALAGIAAVDTAMDKLELDVTKSAARIRSATMTMGKVMAGVGLIAGVGLASGVKNATDTFATFEQTVANATSVTGAVGDEYDRVNNNITEIAKTLGRSTVFSSNQAADALYDLASAGYAVGDMVADDLRPVMDLAAATQTDLTETTQSVTSTLGQFNLGIQDSGRVADVFARTIGSSKATLEKITLSMRYIGPVAQAMNMDLEQVNAMLGELYDNGFRGEQAGRALRQGLSRLLDPTADAKKVLGEMGLAMSSVHPEMNEMNDILETFRDKGITANQAIRLFGIEAAPAILALIKNVDDVRELGAVIEESGGAAAYMAEKQLDTLEGSSILLKSALEVLRIEIGSMWGEDVKQLNIHLQELVNKMIDRVPAAFAKVREGIRNLRPAWENLQSIFWSTIGIIGDVKDAFLGSGYDMNSFAETINKVTRAVAEFLAFIDRHPMITKFVVAIGAIIVAFSFMLPIVTAVATAWGALTTAAALAAAVLTGVIPVGTAVGAVIAAIGGPITLIAAAIAIFAGLWATNMFDIRDKTKVVIDFIIDKFTALVNKIGPALTSLYNKFVDLVNHLQPQFERLGYHFDKMDRMEWKGFERPFSNWGDQSKKEDEASLDPGLDAYYGSNMYPSPNRLTGDEDRWNDEENTGPLTVRHLQKNEEAKQVNKNGFQLVADKLDVVGGKIDNLGTVVKKSGGSSSGGRSMGDIVKESAVADTIKVKPKWL